MKNPALYIIFFLTSLIFSGGHAFAKDKQEALKAYEIAPGSTIKIPKSWEFNTYPMPPDLSASNIRIYTKGVTIAITGMYNLGEKTKTEEEWEALLKQATQGMLQESTEQTFTATHFTTATYKGVFTSLTAKDKSRGFNVLVSEKSYKAGTAIVYKQGIVFSISISLNKDNKAGLQNYQAAFKALETIE